MTRTMVGPDNQQEFFTLANNNINMLDQRSRKELIKAMQTGQREASMTTLNGGKWFKVKSVQFGADTLKNRFLKHGSLPTAEIISRLTT